MGATISSKNMALIKHYLRVVNDVLILGTTWCFAKFPKYNWLFYQSILTCECSIRVVDQLTSTVYM